MLIFYCYSCIVVAGCKFFTSSHIVFQVDFFLNKVQVEVLKSRQKDKREMLEQVKKYRKG